MYAHLNLAKACLWTLKKVPACFRDYEDDCESDDSETELDRAEEEEAEADEEADEADEADCAACCWPVAASPDSTLLSLRLFFLRNDNDPLCSAA